MDVDGLGGEFHEPAVAVGELLPLDDAHKPSKREPVPNAASSLADRGKGEAFGGLDAVQLGLAVVDDVRQAVERDVRELPLAAEFRAVEVSRRVGRVEFAGS